MIEIGIYQELTVVSLKEQGVYLGEKEDADRMERVLLPKKQVPEGTEAGISCVSSSTGIPPTV